MLEHFANIFQADWYKILLMSFLTRHLDSVDETYLAHARHALGFSAQLLVGGIVCLVHAVLPFLFERTGSDIIRRLNDRMVVNRRRASDGRVENCRNELARE